MPDIAIWYFVVASLGSPLEPSRLGPLTSAQCEAFRAAVPTLPGICRRAIAMTNCQVPGRPDVGYACPVFEGDIPQALAK